MSIPTYVVIPNSDIDPESPITTSLMTSLRDNPIALNALWTYTESTTLTIPFDGFYQIICVGGGQGGDRGADGSGAGWSSTVITNRQVTKDGSSDTHTGGVGGTSSVYLSATEIITCPGGGSTTAPSFQTGSHSFENQFEGSTNQQANPGAGGDGGGSPFGVGGSGVLSGDGTDATGYGAGGGGGWVQDGAQIGSRGHGGMAGNAADTLVTLSTNDVLTITVGDAGTGVAATSWGAGGNGSPGIVLIKWWPDTLNLGL